MFNSSPNVVCVIKVTCFPSQKSMRAGTLTCRVKTNLTVGPICVRCKARQTKVHVQITQTRHKIEFGNLKNALFFPLGVCPFCIVPVIRLQHYVLFIFYCTLVFV